jgi:preprotein translocase subunit SecA
MANFLAKLLGGTKSEKDIKLIKPIVTEINQYYEKFNSLTEDELKAKTI